MTGTKLEIAPTPELASSGEYAVGLPQTVAKNFQAVFPNEKKFFGPDFIIRMCKWLENRWHKNGICWLWSKLNF
jgi:hypothetical protein